MKNVILKFLVICLMAQSYATSSWAQVAPAPLDLGKLEKMLDAGQITEDEYNNYIDLIESGGETAIMTDLGQRDMTPEIEELINNPNIKDIGGATSVKELSESAEKLVKGYGDWAFHFVYIKADGTKIPLTARNLNMPIRPASTMKLFSTSLAYDLKTYDLGLMKTLLERSQNLQADNALKSTLKSDQYKNYGIPAGSYLLNPDLLNYKMSDVGGSKTITKDILKGCAAMQHAYSGLEDSSKFHPVNGSGLQQTDKDTDLQTNTVTARLETALLERILTNKAKYDKYKLLLPIAGKTGTLAKRFSAKLYPEARNYAKIYAKTGTLGNTKALAGYAQTPKGTIVFSIIGDRLKGMSVGSAMSGPIEKIVHAHIKYIKDLESKDAGAATAVKK